MERRLIDLVGKAVAYFHPSLTHVGIRVVIIASHINGVIILPVAIDHDPAPAGNLTHKPQKIELVTSLQSGCPFKDEDDCICRVDLQGIIKCGFDLPWTVYDDFMAECFGYSSVIVHILRAPPIFIDPMHEYETHLSVPLC